MRSTLIAALAIPISLIGTFALMWLQGFTLNVITLLALALAVGIVIDDAIVVLENVFRFVNEKKLSPRAAAIQATQEIGLAVLATTLSLLAYSKTLALITHWTDFVHTRLHGGLLLRRRFETFIDRESRADLSAGVGTMAGLEIWLGPSGWKSDSPAPDTHVEVANAR